MQESEVEGRKNGAVGMSRLELSAPVISGQVVGSNTRHGCLVYITDVESFICSQSSDGLKETFSEQCWQ
ncbi:hypothetical protein J6590_104804, partial [Homalodisca vitripennis]